MPSKANTPAGLKPYKFHGLDYSYSGGKDAYADCPFCTRTGKFSIRADDGRFRCWKCGEKGNVLVFLRRLWEDSLASTQDSDRQELANYLNLISSKPIKEWGLAVSILNRNWLIPGYSPKGKITQLYRRLRIKQGDEWKWRVLATPKVDDKTKMTHGLLGFPLFDQDKPIVHLCEGIWDAIAWRETLGYAQEGNDSDEDEVKLIPTKRAEDSLLSITNVLGVPGINVFFDYWKPLFAGKTVCILLDNDHPRTHPKTGKQIPPAARSACKSITQKLISGSSPPKAVFTLSWGKRGYDKNLPSGFDLRDLLNAKDTI